jgi:hypothetical protein
MKVNINNFVRAVGRKQALTNLIKVMRSMNLLPTKEDRAAIWNTYFQNFKKV